MESAQRILVVDLAAQAPAWALPPWAVDAIASAAPPGWDARFVSSPTISDGDGGDKPSDEAMEAVRGAGGAPGAEAYTGFGVPPALLAAGAGLRWVHTATAGVGSLLSPELRERAIPLTNSAGVHGPPIAEYVLAGVLHFLRGFDMAGELQRRGEWDRDRFTGGGDVLRELNECRALIVGVGGIGGGVAARFAPLGVICTGVRRRVDRPLPEGFTATIGLDALRDELPRADILVLATPLTGSTEGLVGAAELELLPPGAIVVNVARGGLLDENALAERLENGTLRGAVLDVFEREPLPPGSPLWNCSRALITPHVSGVSPRRFWEREVELLIDNWTRYHNGTPLRNLVDQQAGY